MFSCSVFMCRLKKRLFLLSLKSGKKRSAFLKLSWDVPDPTGFLRRALRAVPCLTGACWFFYVIILDSLNISMHTYALPDANCLALRHVGFYRSACALNGDLQCHKRNTIAAKPSGMTKEGLGCPLNPVVIHKRAANILHICLKCRKGEGLSCSSGLPPVASLLSGIMFHFCHSIQYFRSKSICKQPRHSALYFHVNII